MPSDLQQDVRILRRYVIVMTLVVLGLGVSAYRSREPVRRFREIDVERLNVIEPDGTLRLVLSDRTRYPGVIVKGNEHPSSRGQPQAGLLFFNDEGTEDGGIAYAATRRKGGYQAMGEIMFDQYGQNQTVGLSYEEVNGRRTAGLHVWDRPDSVPIARLVDSFEVISHMPEGPEQTRALQAYRRATGTTRVFAGKTADRVATVALSDVYGRPRLRLLVDSTGAARIEFLDSTGRVTTSVPSARSVASGH